MIRGDESVFLTVNLFIRQHIFEWFGKVITKLKLKGVNYGPVGSFIK